MRKTMKILWLFLLFFTVLSPQSKADFQTEEKQTELTADKLLKATVNVELGDAHGSGFFIRPDLIITNEHVVRGRILFITMYDGKTCEAHAGYREEGVDLAIIHPSCKSDTVLDFAESSKIGQSIIAVGNPGSYSFTVSKGIVSAYLYDMIQFDAKVNHGSSGGVLGDLSGNVVGIVKAKAVDDPYIAFAVPSDKIKKFLQRAEVK